MTTWGPHYDTETVQREINAAIEAACNGLQRVVLQQLETYSTTRRMPQLESPLEAVFEVWWTALVHVAPVWARELELTRQHPVKRSDGSITYRFDFVVGLHHDTWCRPVEPDVAARFPQIAVEIDGHEFHERTREQVTYRNQRDRDLQKTGWHIFHFSGSEVFADPERCVREVLEFAITAVMDARHPEIVELTRQGSR